MWTGATLHPHVPLGGTHSPFLVGGPTLWCMSVTVQTLSPWCRGEALGKLCTHLGSGGSCPVGWACLPAPGIPSQHQLMDASTSRRSPLFFCPWLHWTWAFVWEAGHVYRVAVGELVDRFGAAESPLALSPPAACDCLGYSDAQRLGSGAEFHPNIT